MFPTRKEWRAWSSFDRIAYISQLAAALALVPSVVFTWMTWREARLLRQDERAMFLSEKAPQVVVGRLYIEDDRLKVDVSNDGESTAKDVRLAVFFDGKGNQLVRFETSSDLVASFPKYPDEKYKGFNIRKGDSKSITIGSLERLSKETGKVVQSVHDSEPGEWKKVPRGSLTGWLRLTYVDAVESPYHLSRPFLVAPK